MRLCKDLTAVQLERNILYDLVPSLDTLAPSFEFSKHLERSTGKLAMALPTKALIHAEET